MKPYQWACALLALPPEARHAALADCPAEWRALVLATIESITAKGPEAYAQKIARTAGRPARQALLMAVPYEHRPEVERQVREIFNVRRKA